MTGPSFHSPRDAPARPVPQRPSMQKPSEQKPPEQGPLRKALELLGMAILTPFVLLMELEELGLFIVAFAAVVGLVTAVVTGSWLLGAVVAFAVVVAAAALAAGAEVLFEVVLAKLFGRATGPRKSSADESKSGDGPVGPTTP